MQILKRNEAILSLEMGLEVKNSKQNHFLYLAVKQYRILTNQKCAREEVFLKSLIAKCAIGLNLPITYFKNVFRARKVWTALMGNCLDAK